MPDLLHMTQTIRNTSTYLQLIRKINHLIKKNKMLRLAKF